MLNIGFFILNIINFELYQNGLLLLKSVRNILERIKFLEATLKNLRKVKGIIGAQLAKELSISERSIIRWEEDFGDASFKYVVKIPQFFEGRMEEIEYKFTN